MTFSLDRRSVLSGGALTAGIPLARATPARPQREDVSAVAAVPLFSQLSGYAIAPDAKTVVTAGHTVPGVGSARYLFDPIAVDPAAIAARFPLTAVLAGDGRLFRLDTAGGVSAQALGAVADGVTDDAPAIQQFLDSLGSVADGGADTPRVTINFHGCRYRLGTPLRIVQNLVALHAEGATLDGGGQARRLIEVDHDNSVNSPTGVAITGRWFLRGSRGDAIALSSAPLFTIGHLHASGIAGDVVRVQGCVGGTVEMIEAYECKGLAYRETAFLKRFRGDGGGKQVNCINNRVDAIRAYHCGGAWLASESWHASVGRIDVESSTGVGVTAESCLSPSFESIYEEDHTLGILVQSRPRVFDANFPTGFAQFDTLFTGGAPVASGQRPCSIEIRDGTRAVLRAGRVGGDIRIGAAARGTRIGAEVELLGRMEDGGVATRIERSARCVVTVRAGEAGADVTFERAVSDDRYLPLVRAIAWTGKPSPGALLGRGVRPTRGGFKLEVLEVVGPGCTVTFLAEAG